MSTATSKEKINEIENEAYTVVDATNEDGTVDAEIITTPDRDGDTVYFDVAPLTPTVDSDTVELEWPHKHTDEYAIVRLCREKVGGFPSIGNLKGKNVKVELNPEENTFELAILNQDQPELRRHEKYIQKVKTKFERVFNKKLEYFLRCVGVLGILGILTPIALLLAVPWNIYILSVGQGVSLVFSSLGVLFATAALLDKVEEE